MNIYCRNCENECSEQAPICPKCGHPLRPPLAKPSPPPIQQLAEATQARPVRQPIVVRPVQVVQTIEQTSKGWKALIALGVVTILISLGGCLFDWADAVTELQAGQHATPNYSSWWPEGLAIGFTVYVISRIGAWWDHG